MNYLLLKNGSVVTPENIEETDILVGGNKILQMGKDLKRPTAQTPVIDASGKFIMPGCIDTNRQFLNLIGCDTNPDEILKLNQAQIYNGTTSMLDSIEDIYKKDYLFNISKAKKKAGQNNIDYGLHLHFSKLKDITTDAIDYSYLREGVTSLTINISKFYNVSEPVLQNILSGILNNNLLLICDTNVVENKSKAKHKSHHDMEKIISHHFKTLKMMIDLGVNYGCSIMFANISYVEEYNLIQDGLVRHGDFYGSLSLPFNINVKHKEKSNTHFNSSLNYGGGQLTLLSEEAVWQILKINRFIISSPSFYLNSSTQNNEELVYNRPDKYYYLRNYLSVLFTAGVRQNQINIKKLVDITSTLPAKLMGMYPQKGIIRPGADADIVVWNPDFDRNLRCSLPTAESNYNTYKLKGRCDFVFLRGKMLYNGELYDSKQTQGTYIYRTALDQVTLE